MRRSSSPATAPSTPTVASAVSSGSAPVKTRLPNMSGWKRAPSSLVKKATASGRRVTTPASVERLDDLEPGENPERAVVAPAGAHGVDVAAHHDGRAVLAAARARPRHCRSRRSRRRGPSSRIQPTTRSRPCLSASVSARRLTPPSGRAPASASRSRRERSRAPFTRRFCRIAGLGHGLLRRPCEERSDEAIQWRRDASGSLRFARIDAARPGCDNETPRSSLRPGITDGT